MSSIVFPFSSTDFLSIQEAISPALSKTVGEWLFNGSVESISANLLKEREVSVDGRVIEYSSLDNNISFSVNAESFSKAMNLPQSDNEISTRLSNNIFRDFAKQCLESVVGEELFDVCNGGLPDEILKLENDFISPVLITVITSVGKIEFTLCRSSAGKLLAPKTIPLQRGSLTPVDISIENESVELEISAGLIHTNLLNLYQLKPGSVLKLDSSISRPLPVNLRGTTVAEAFLGRRGDKKAIVFS